MSSEDRRGLLRLLYVSVFLVATAIGTPMMLAAVQAENLGATLLEIGLMGTAAAAVYTVMTLVAGALLDRFEKVRLYLAFNVISTACLVYFIFVTDVQQMFIARILIGVAGGAFWAAAGAITADLAPPELLTHAIGRYNLSWILGFVIGPLAGGWIADSYGYATLWGMLTVFMLAGLAVNVVMARRIRLESGSDVIKFDFSAVGSLKWAYITMIPYALGLGIYFYILPGYMAERGLSATIIGFLLALNSAVKGVGFFYSERVVALGVRRGMLAGSVTLALSLIGVAYASSALDFLLPHAALRRRQRRDRAHHRQLHRTRFTPRQPRRHDELLRVHLRRLHLRQPHTRGLRQPDLPGLRHVRGPRPSHTTYNPSFGAPQKTGRWVGITLRSARAPPIFFNTEPSPPG